MGAVTDEMMVEGVASGEGDHVSDSKAFSAIIQTLDSVRMVSSPIDRSNRDNYDYILSLLDPSARYEPEQEKREAEEALLTPVLKALTQAVSRIDTTYHASLLNNVKDLWKFSQNNGNQSVMPVDCYELTVFGMHVWYFGGNTRTALLDLITTLAAVPDKYLEGCLHMLVSNFVPPERVLKWLDEPKWVIRKRIVHQELHACLQNIFKCIPLAPFKLSDALNKAMPRIFESKAKLNAFVECMLGLLREEIGDVLSATLLSKVINLLSELDVNITWNDVLQEDQTMGIFDMELEDLEDHFLQFPCDDTKVGVPFYKRGVNSNNNSAFVEKIDGLMVVVCEHLNSRVKSGRLLTDYNLFMDIFRSSVLKLHKTKFTQFVMFYACSLDETWGQTFAVDLAGIFLSTSEDSVSRMSAISYLASYLSRAKFISSSVIAAILTRLVNWCSDYCKDVLGRKLNPILGRAFNPVAHQVYYSACQAVMYILCFRMRQLLDVPTEAPARSFLFDLPLGYILFNGLDPLKVCLPSIVQEFLRQAKAARLFNASVSSIDENTIDSELSKAFGGTERLDIFFPFDPYLLKESDRFIRPHFVYWSMVKTAYSNYNSDEDNEEDEELQDLDAPIISSYPIGSFEDQYDSDEEGDDLECSLNKMSITPKQTFNLHMPAKIRPSVSPPV